MKDCTATPQTSAVTATSSTPRVLPGEQEALFREVLLILEDTGCSYAVAGAFALRQHTGICRFTKDLDVFLTTGAASEVLPIFEQRGFHCEVCDSILWPKSTETDISSTSSRA
jgi:hypothetical protein